MATVIILLIQIIQFNSSKCKINWISGKSVRRHVINNQNPVLKISLTSPTLTDLINDDGDHHANSP